jgi:hypothetical protein
MLSLLKKIFGATAPAETAAPYKVEAAPMAPAVSGTPLGNNTMSTAPKKVAKKSVAKKVATAKPKASRKPKTPKA